MNQGASQTFAITPDTGFYISDVQVDGASIGAVTTYAFSSITANHSVIASFAPKTYTITATAGGGGTVTPSGTVTVNQGMTQTYAIAPNAGYAIASVIVDGTSVGAVSTYTFGKVTANHTISGSFATINVPAISVSPASYTFKSTKVRYSSSKTFIITNTGKANLTVLKVELTGTDANMFQTSFTGTKTLGPSRYFYQKVTFKPTSKGIKNAVLQFTSNDPKTPVISIPLSGSGM